jgi:hypothetical protein
MTLTLHRVDSLRPIPPSRSIEAPQSDPSRVKEEDRQVEVLCREGISLILTFGGSPPFEGTGSSLKDDGNRAPSTQSAAASRAELQSPPTATASANSEAAENQPLTFFTAKFCKG